MLEHRACCVDLIKFISVLFAVGPRYSAIFVRLCLLSFNNTDIVEQEPRDPAEFLGQLRCVVGKPRPSLLLQLEMD